MSSNSEARALLAERLLNRRAILGGLTGSIAAAAAFTLPARAAGPEEEPAAAGQPSDRDLLTFALNLEYLEAEFYTYAVTGNGIDAHGHETDGMGTPDSSTRG